MKINELREMTDQELKSKLADFRGELMNLRFQGSVAKLDNPVRVRGIRRDIARITTLMNQRAAETRKKARS